MCHGYTFRVDEHGCVQCNAEDVSRTQKATIREPLKATAGEQGSSTRSFVCVCVCVCSLLPRESYDGRGRLPTQPLCACCAHHEDAAPERALIMRYGVSLPVLLE